MLNMETDQIWFRNPKPDGSNEPACVYLVHVGPNITNQTPVFVSISVSSALIKKRTLAFRTLIKGEIMI